LHASRDHLLSIGPAGMVSVAGGKLTTHRQIALDALRHLPDRVKPRRPSLSDVALPGAVPTRGWHRRTLLDRSMVDHLMHLYGSEAHKVLAYDWALERITPSAPDIWAQVHHAIREEWVVTADDIIYRRTILGIRGFDTPEVRQKIDAFLPSAPGVETLWPGDFKALR